MFSDVIFYLLPKMFLAKYLEIPSRRTLYKKLSGKTEK